MWLPLMLFIQFSFGEHLLFFKKRNIASLHRKGQRSDLVLCYIFLPPVILDLCPLFCLQKWNLLCHWEYHAACVWVQFCGHEETILSDPNHSGNESDSAMSISRKLQPDKPDRVVQGECQTPPTLTFESTLTVQWSVSWDLHFFLCDLKYNFHFILKSV